MLAIGLVSAKYANILKYIVRTTINIQTKILISFIGAYFVRVGGGGG
jgi:hypothetical protein